jgi:creatinine amidohydrolase
MQFGQQIESSRRKQMREVRFELLRPHEIEFEKQKAPFVFLPLSPLEWHGPHLPFGFDALNAYSMALELAGRMGGLVLPCMYIGAAQVVGSEKLRNIGFRGDEYIVGRDYHPKNMQSFYFHEEVLAVTLRNYLELLDGRDYKAVIIVNTHGEKNHNDTIERLCSELNNTRHTKFYATRAMNRDEVNYPYKYKSDDQVLAEKYRGQPGHAGKAETSLARFYFDSRVDLSQLPPAKEKLYNTRWAITDSKTTHGRPTPDFTVREEEDPRAATVEEGKRVFEEAIEQRMTEIMDFFEEIGFRYTLDS